jgi:hypothetical protein
LIERAAIEMTEISIQTTMNQSRSSFNECGKLSIKRRSTASSSLSAETLSESQRIVEAYDRGRRSHSFDEEGEENGIGAIDHYGFILDFQENLDYSLNILIGRGNYEYPLVER